VDSESDSGEHVHRQVAHRRHVRPADAAAWAGGHVSGSHLTPRVSFISPGAAGCSWGHASVSRPRSAR
jgi:hypothetical protein